MLLLGMDGGILPAPVLIWAFVGGQIERHVWIKVLMKEEQHYLSYGKEAKSVIATRIYPRIVTIKIQRQLKLHATKSICLMNASLCALFSVSSYDAVEHQNQLPSLSP